MRTILLILALLCVSPAWAADIPDPESTPGAINPDVTPATLRQTVCVKGWTKTVRPPASYTGRLKRAEIGPEADPRDYEEDHLIPLCAGGAPADRRNLWAEYRRGPWGAYAKDRLEIKICSMLCRGEISLAEAQAAWSPDWRVSYQRYCPTDADCPSYRDLHPDD